MKYSFPYSKKNLAALASLTNSIVEMFGVPLTLRQIFYQLEQKHGLIPEENQEDDKVKLQAYKRLSEKLVDARVLGLVPWDSMIDNTRGIKEVSAWIDEKDFIEDVTNAYRRDVNLHQPKRVEVWCEKAIALSHITNKYRVALVAGGGYRSKSNLWEAAKRFSGYDKSIKIIYLGDFDPSGMDIDRDLSKAFKEIWGLKVEVERILLTREDTLRLTSKGPANKKDSRYKKYVKKYGTNQAWELDALDPPEIYDRVEKAIKNNLDMGIFEWQKIIEKSQQEKITRFIESYKD